MKSVSILVARIVVRATGCLALFLCASDHTPSLFAPQAQINSAFKLFIQHITSLQRRKHIEAMGCLSRLVLGLLFMGAPLSSFAWDTGYREVSSDGQARKGGFWDVCVWYRSYFVTHTLVRRLIDRETIVCVGRSLSAP